MRVFGDNSEKYLTRCWKNLEKRAHQKHGKKTCCMDRTSSSIWKASRKKVKIPSGNISLFITSKEATKQAWLHNRTTTTPLSHKQPTHNMLFHHLLYFQNTICPSQLNTNSKQSPLQSLTKLFNLILLQGWIWEFRGLRQTLRNGPQNIATAKVRTGWLVQIWWEACTYRDSFWKQYGKWSVTTQNAATGG